VEERKRKERQTERSAAAMSSGMSSIRNGAGKGAALVVAISWCLSVTKGERMFCSCFFTSFTSPWGDGPPPRRYILRQKSRRMPSRNCLERMFFYFHKYDTHRSWSASCLNILVETMLWFCRKERMEVGRWTEQAYRHSESFNHIISPNNHDAYAMGIIWCTPISRASI